ncbi:MAG TPA: phosphatidylglycerophosphatase A [Candidatus Binataceae bacterium]|nr:phosphatidylglycerophosphatase A [Candidatus Binataceae bacterium]
MRQVIIFFATGVYTGYSPFAPGTAGSVVGLIIGYFFCAPMWQDEPMIFAAIFAAAFVPACLIAGRAEQIFGEHDSSKIVLDEVMGMIATMFLNPLGWRWLLGGFLLFRIFDIIKPFPASLIDRKMPGGPGVMLDDLFAGIYANIVLRILARVL